MLTFDLKHFPLLQKPAVPVKKPVPAKNGTVTLDSDDSSEEDSSDDSSSDDVSTVYNMYLFVLSQVVGLTLNIGQQCLFG